MVILFDQYNPPDDIFAIVFATEQQIVVGRMLIDSMKAQGGEMGKTEMSLFANQLHEGIKIPAKQAGPLKIGSASTLSYNKRQFYDRILTPMRAMGMIDYDVYRKKYKISNIFNNAMIKIGLMWVQEVRKPV